MCLNLAPQVVFLLFNRPGETIESEKLYFLAVLICSVYIIVCLFVSPPPPFLSVCVCVCVREPIILICAH